MTILVGTASWTDKSLIDSGKFYPGAATSAEERLRYYASQFPLVEVDSSYYAIPAPQTAQLWAERTPSNFTFNVKAFRALTGHQFDARVLPKDMQRALGAQSGNLYYKDRLTFGVCAHSFPTWAAGIADALSTAGSPPDLRRRNFR